METKSNVVALVDVNNFFVSCERVFLPALEKRPVAVLSNNDGCVVARSNEVKALDVPMAVPFYQVREIFEKHKVVVFSSNFQLYGDMSDRVMSILSRFSPYQEIYSIDECFLDFSGFSHLNLTEYAHEIRNCVRQWIGLPISIGIAPTKTLAKLANHFAKTRPEFENVCDLTALSSGEFDVLLASVHVGKVWGIGHELKDKLMRMGIKTPLDLRNANPDLIRSRFSITVERTVEELRGEGCVTLDDSFEPRKQIMSTRSFGVPVYSLNDLSEAVASYIARAVEKLREQQSAAGGLMVFIRTSPHIDKEKRFQKSWYTHLPTHTDNIFTLTQTAIAGLKTIYRSGPKYQKAGILLTHLIPASQQQRTLFDNPQEEEKASRLLDTLDEINQEMGRGTIHLASEGCNQSWKVKSEKRTPPYTTRWDSILNVW